MNTIQDRKPNLRDSSGQLYLVRCFHCEPEYGRENGAGNVVRGVCSWCGWSESSTTKDDKQ